MQSDDMCHMQPSCNLLSDCAERVVLFLRSSFDSFRSHENLFASGNSLQCISALWPRVPEGLLEPEP